MNVSEIMTTDVQVIGPQETLQHAAQLMDQLNVGALPVCDGRHLLGMVTDRDITVRGTAAGFGPEEACVSDVMSTGTEWCTEDQDTDEVMRLMGEAQVRRLPVINTKRELVGIVSLGDLATKQPGHIDRAVREISTPSEPDGGADKS
jgi:CBS domain-containing protein